MQKPALIIHSLSIHTMPGFPNGLKSMNSLAKNINVIAGPNASGKSSTARMMQQVIWKQNIERIRVETKLEIAKKKWHIRIDNGYYSSQSNGFEETLPSIPAVEEAKRYYLALHELIKEEDQNLAATILQEAIGGYDLQAAGKSLGFSSATPNRGIKEFKTYEAKQKKVEQIESKQKNLQHEERKLSDLDEKLKNAKEAAVLKQGYMYLLEFLEAKSKKELLKEQKDLFPKQMPLLIGNEYEAVIDLEQHIEEHNLEITRIHREKDSITNELSALQIPKEGFDKVILDTLHEKIETLSELQRSLESRHLIITKNEEETKITLHRLFSDLKKENLDKVTLENIHDLDDFFEKAARTLYKKQRTEFEIENLKKESKEQINKLEDVHYGIQILLNWYKKDATPTSISKTPFWILLLLGAITFVLTYFLKWIGVIGLVFMLTYVIYLNQRKKPSDSIKDSRVNDFKKIGLKEPANWQEEAVSHRIAELHQELQEINHQQKINLRLEELYNTLENILLNFNELENKRLEWIEKLSDIPELNVENIARYSSLYWFLKDLHTWQKHTKELIANRVTYNEENKVYLNTLVQINNLFSEVQVESATEVASAKASLKNMLESQHNHTTLLSKLENLREQKSVYYGLLEKDKESLKGIYRRLHLEIGAKDELKRLLDRKTDFQDFEKNFEQAKRSFIEKEKQLKDHSLFDQIKEDFPAIKLEKAKERKEEYARLAGEIEKLNSEITKIKTLVGEEQTGRELEVALAEREAALEALEIHYQNTRAAITGELILNGLRNKTQENSDLKVLNRAKELFSKITHGHFELLLDDSEGGNFRARNTILNQGLKLEQLSSGTRIQLLIAVRLAFIESQETSVKLPIIVDEVLANSDDLRAKQIIEALVEISKEGRQIFYFTAQSDEVIKWQEYLSQHPEVESKTVILESKQTTEQMDYELMNQTTAPTLITAQVLSPENLTREAYHEQLNPPKYNFLSDTTRGLHLSYLIENNQVLYSCLQRGIHYYGHLESFIKSQGKLQGFTDEKLKNISEKILLLKSYQHLYQKGRAKPINRAVLQASRSVSDIFIDAVDAKLKELENNPKKLLIALREREISGFMRAKIDELEEYLTEHDFINEEEILSTDEINLQLQAVLSRMELTPDEAEQFLKKLIEFTYN